MRDSAKLVQLLLVSRKVYKNLYSFRVITNNLIPSKKESKRILDSGHIDENVISSQQNQEKVS